jgi:hypothetical protein
MTTSTPVAQWVTIRVLAGHLGVSERLIMKLRDNGQLPEGCCIRVGASVRYDLPRILSHFTAQ